MVFVALSRPLAMAIVAIKIVPTYKKCNDVGVPRYRYHDHDHDDDDTVLYGQRVAGWSQISISDRSTPLWLEPCLFFYTVVVMKWENAIMWQTKKG